MSDKLKKHIDGNRDQFEVYDFDLDQGWKEIAPKVGVSKQKKTVTIQVNWLYRSAAAVLLLALSLAFLDYKSEQNQLPSEYWEAHSFYQGQIDMKLTEVKSRLDDPSVLQDLEDLDQTISELKRDLKDDAQNEEVIIAMIENYRLKLMILEKILEELEEKDYEKDNSI